MASFVDVVQTAFMCKDRLLLILGSCLVRSVYYRDVCVIAYSAYACSFLALNGDSLSKNQT